MLHFRWRLYLFSFVLLLDNISDFVDSISPTYRPFSEAGPWLEKETVNMKQRILQLHSETRGKAALGASNMLALKWNDQLASLADKKAKQCGFFHGDLVLPDGRHVGQNIAKYASFVPNPVDALVNMWQMEQVNFNVSNAMCSEKRTLDIPCGHYHQMVTAETQEIGCAINVCPICPWLKGDDETRRGEGEEAPCYWFDVLLVCDYLPRGGVWQPAYTIGSPCSGCNLRPGTQCIDNQCVPCSGNGGDGGGSKSSGGSSSTSSGNMTSNTPSNTSVGSIGISGTSISTDCRPFSVYECVDQFSRCHKILEDDFCSNPITGIWARRHCQRFCKFC